MKECGLNLGDTPLLSHEIEEGSAKDWDRRAGEERGTLEECDVLEAKRKATLENLNCLLAYINILLPRQ